MVRKVRVMLVSLVLICALCTSAQAYSHEVYDGGNISTTYITYFKDILSGSKFSDNYIAFRSGQNEYKMIVGKLQCDNGIISLKIDETAKEYTFATESTSYNSRMTYDVKDIYFFDIDTADYIIYSDVGDFPQLIERGAKFETLNTFLIITVLMCIVINRIFFYSKRR